MATYLTSNTGTATNANKFTYSVWLKRSQLCDTTGQRFYQGYQDGNNRFYIMFDNTNSNPDSLWIYNVIGGATKLYWVSNRKFRDLNAWYHIVLSADSTQGTEADRFKVYINGVEETGWTKNNNQPQNVNWGNQLAQTNGDQTISGTESQTQPFLGLMSHINFIDGTAYPATAFGSTDATTGEWKINVSPNVTYGNNGYFILKDGNTITDSSPNSNNFTLASGTLTKTEDCPSNIISNLLGSYPSNPTGGFDNGSTTAKTGNADTTWRACFSSIATPPSGKYYCELKWVSGSHLEWGAVSSQTISNNNFKDWTTSYTGEYLCLYGANWYNKNSSQGTYESGIQLTSGNIGMMAIDRDNNKFWWGLNGSWGGSQNPATNTGGVSLTGHLDDFWHLGASVYSNSGVGVYEFNFGNGYFGTTQISSEGTNASGIGKFEYNVPNGFTALSTKGLNL